MLRDTLPLMRPLDRQDLNVWRVYWGDVERWIAPLFPRSDSRARAMAYLAGLLSPAERKTSWQLAELMGDANPYHFQHLLGRAAWDPDALRDQLLAYVPTYLGDPGAIGVLDETGFLKKGTHSVGVARQYSGTAGHIDNCQIGVFLAYASVHGQTLLDRELYLPEGWAADAARRQQVGIPAERRFATKPALARQMLARAAAAQVTFAWVTADTVYGDDRPLRQWLEAQPQAYVVAVTDKEHLWVGHQACAHATLVARLAPDAWETHTSGMGSQGPRLFAWQRLALNPVARDGWQQWVVFRRRVDDPSDIRVYRAFGPTDTTLATLAQVAGTRWAVEDSIQVAKGEVGLDHYEVRSWTGWYRHITLALWAQAFLAVIRAETGTSLVGGQKKAFPQRESSLAAFKASRRIGYS